MLHYNFFHNLNDLSRNEAVSCFIMSKKV